MGGGGVSQAMKRIPRIKFPQRHPKTSPGSISQTKATSENGNASQNFSLASPAMKVSAGGKASLQPKRAPVSKEEIEAILLGGCL